MQRPEPSFEEVRAVVREKLTAPSKPHPGLERLAAQYMEWSESAREYTGWSDPIKRIYGAFENGMAFAFSYATQNPRRTFGTGAVLSGLGIVGEVVAGNYLGAVPVAFAMAGMALSLRTTSRMSPEHRQEVLNSLKVRSQRMAPANDCG